MKALLAFTLTLAFAAQAHAFDNERFGPYAKPTTEQLQKCEAQFPSDFCQDTAKLSNTAQFETILEKLQTELTAYNVHF